MTTSNLTFTTRLELRFWDWAIPTLKTSHRLHWLLKQARPLTDPIVVRKLGIRSLVVSLAGLASGAAAYGILVR